MFWKIRIRDITDLIRFALAELQRDVEAELLKLPESERKQNYPEFAVFVVHNKLKEKIGRLPATVP